MTEYCSICFSFYFFFLIKSDQPTHSMRSLEQKRYVLQSIGDDWLANFNVPGRFKNCQGSCTKAKGFYRLSIMGCVFTYSVEEFELSDGQHTFKCAKSECGARARVYGQAENIAKAVSKRHLLMNDVDIELLSSHSCGLVEYQGTVLRYMDIIRRYLLDDQTAELNSYTGFKVYEDNVGARGILNAPVGIYDHLFSWRARAESTSSTHAYCNNGLNLICGVNKKKPCGAVVDICLYRIHTCQVVGKSGVHSNPIADSFSYEFKMNGVICSVEKRCTNPIYMYNNANILSNGLRCIIPKLDVYVDLCKWTDGFIEYSLMIEEAFEEERLNRPDGDFFDVPDIEEDEVMLFADERQNRPGMDFFDVADIDENDLHDMDVEMGE